MLNLPPLALYIHIPWCVRKCPYCDFNSHEATDDLPERAYLAALKSDLDHELAAVQGRKLASIFIGGGTPSLVAPATIAGILEAAEQVIGFDAAIEITMEANPGTFEQKRFRGFRAAGVNRLSLGIQSFHNPHLKRLGRIHDRADAIEAAGRAREAGFDNFNLDLMHGLPDQTPSQAAADLQTAIDLGPDHISWYQLTIEPNTRFYKHPPTLPAEDRLEQIQEAGHELLTDNGFARYEVSAYARNGRRSLHNLNYWQFGDYLGIGAGAHGKITLPDRGEIVRTAKTRKPEHYLNRRDNFFADRQAIDTDELPLEFFMNALRLIEGVPPELYPRRTGLDFENQAERWRQLQQQGLVADPREQLAATPLGLRFLDSVLAALAGD